jgi:hypothetical protein
MLTLGMFVWTWKDVVELAFLFCVVAGFVTIGIVLLFVKVCDWWAGRWKGTRSKGRKR